MKVISVDVGATSGRVMVVNYINNNISYEEIYRFNTTLIIDKTTIKWDIEKLVNNIKEGINLSLHKYSDIMGIGIDTWGVDYCYLDKYGNLISNPYCYRDTRTYQSSKEVNKIIDLETLFNINGLQNLHFNTIYQLYDDFKNRKDELKDVRTLLMIPDYIAYRLTGTKKIELTNLSTTGLYDQQKHCISQLFLDKLGIPNHIFPEIIKPGETIGLLHKKLLPVNYNHDIPVIAVCSHDTASAILATPTDENSVYISSGTWSLLGIESDKPIINKLSFAENFTNEIGYNGKITFLKNAMGMFVINELRNDLKLKGIEIKFNELVDIIDKSDDIYTYLDLDSPDFETPTNMESKIINYINKTKQTLPNNLGQYLRIIYKSMAANYRYLVENIQKITKKEISTVVISGGGANAEVLNQYVANITNKKVITGPKEATLVGNALVQFIALNSIKNEGSARILVKSSFDSKEFIPQNVANWQSEYEQFLLIKKGENKHE